MFALKSHRLGKTKKQSDVARITEQNPDDEIDDTIKARFQEIGPKFTLKMRWIRRGPLGETGHEREARERYEKATGEQATEYGERAGAGADGDDDDEGETFGASSDDEEMPTDGETGADDGEVDNAVGEGDEDDAEAEAAARKAIGLDETDAAGQPNFTGMQDPTAPTPAAAPENSKKRPRTTPRVRKKPYHALLNPPPDSDSDSPEPEAVPLPMAGKKKNPELTSAIATVGHTWHAGKGEGGVRESAKRREWNWEVSLLWVVLRPLPYSATDTSVYDRLACKSRGASSSSDECPKTCATSILSVLSHPHSSFRFSTLLHVFPLVLPVLTFRAGVGSHTPRARSRRERQRGPHARQLWTQARSRA